MTGYKILVLNGPNLGALGKRQPEIYGNSTMDILPELVEQVLGKNTANVSLEFYQNNSEGKLIDRIEQAREERVSQRFGKAFQIASGGKRGYRQLVPQRASTRPHPKRGRADKKQRHTRTRTLHQRIDLERPTESRQGR